MDGRPRQTMNLSSTPWQVIGVEGLCWYQRNVFHFDSCLRESFLEVARTLVAVVVQENAIGWRIASQATSTPTSLQNMVCTYMPRAPLYVASVLLSTRSGCFVIREN
jgi:hypothetical protein